MKQRVSARIYREYERLLEWELSATPTHVAVIQDGNRRYAREQGEEPSTGHEEGAETTEALLRWCEDLGVAEVTLYAFSTENFKRDADEREHIFDLVAEKLRSFADANQIHENEVRVRAIGQTELLPVRVRDAIEYAERKTEGYDSLHLNVALAYGGRAELLDAVRDVARDVQSGGLTSADVDVNTVEGRLYDGPTRDVDLIIRSGGDERTSNFLPWHANGNEAAVYFCTPYWPEFRKTDFLRAIRTYQNREASWRRYRARRALALVRALGSAEVTEARRVLGRLKEALPSKEREAFENEVEVEPSAD